MFNQKYAFNNFRFDYNGTENSFGLNAALSVADNPGKEFNPLLLHGGTGAGKTHLLHAIGQHVLSKRKGVRAALLSAEDLAIEYINAIQKVQISEFRRKYLQMDVLLIDNIQYLVGKERMQDQFYHLFLQLIEWPKQIVMAGNCSPEGLEELTQKLVSRFEWGLVVKLCRTKAADTVGRT